MKRTMPLSLIGFLLVCENLWAFPTKMTDSNILAVLEKRETLIDVVPDEKLKALFPLPHDQTALIEDCQIQTTELERRRCVEAVAQGYFEGHFTEEGQAVCRALKNSELGEYHVQHCLCYQAKNFVAMEQCLEKTENKLQAFLKEQEETRLYERLLAPLQPRVFPSSQVAAPSSPPESPQTYAVHGDLSGEVLGESLPGKEDELAQKQLHGFLDSLGNKKYFEIFTPESYAFHLFANIPFIEREKIAEGLKGAKAQTLEPNTIKILSPDAKSTYNYLVQVHNTWYFDSLRTSIEQKAAVGAPPIAELDEFLVQKNNLVPLVQKAIGTCQNLKAPIFESEKEECPQQLIGFIGAAYHQQPASALYLIVVLEYVDQVLQAPDFNAQNFLTESAFQTLQEREQNPLKFLHKLLSGITSIEKKDENTYFYTGPLPEKKTYFIRKDNRWLIDIQT